MVNENTAYNRVYVRDCYVTLFDQLIDLLKECHDSKRNDARFNAMVTGNPGVGMSYFYLYVIYRIIKNPFLLGDWILVINSGDVFHMFYDGIFEEINPKEIKLNPKILRRKNSSRTTFWLELFYDFVYIVN
jgi:hypothetical protein